jgi:hypothetical protein
MMMVARMVREASEHDRRYISDMLAMRLDP